MPAKFVFHAVGPRYRGGAHGEAEQLRSCYRRAMQLASEHSVASIAFPAISCGIYGYPLDEAAEIAITTVSASLADQTEKRVIFALINPAVEEAFATALMRR